MHVLTTCKVNPAPEIKVARSLIESRRVGTDARRSERILGEPSGEPPDDDGISTAGARDSEPSPSPEPSPTRALPLPRPSPCPLPTASVAPSVSAGWGGGGGGSFPPPASWSFGVVLPLPPLSPGRLGLRGTALFTFRGTWCAWRWGHEKDWASACGTVMCDGLPFVHRRFPTCSDSMVWYESSSLSAEAMRDYQSGRYPLVYWPDLEI